MTVLLLTCCLSLFAACQSEEDVQVEVPATEGQDDMAMQQEGMEQEGLSVEDIEGNPDQYIGQTVTVRGSVDQAYDSTAFMIEGDDMTTSMLVVVPPNTNISGAQGGDLSMMENNMAEVRGTVQSFAVAEIESEYGIDLDPEIEAEIEERRPVIIANNVTMQQNTGMAQDNAGNKQQQQSGQGIQQQNGDELAESNEY